ncbi:Retrotransposon protein [Musa troglodytarum]|uniref:Retrotransposon protein n=1 Tax=Musa troglodytarum TaxID=320322 RepID=A0A9E7K7B9_9LILI|nr:Retrotransposon protein [Musa troglodytarum]
MCYCDEVSSPALALGMIERSHQGTEVSKEDRVSSTRGADINSKDLEWIIDTGASYHVTPQREFFATYRFRNFGIVKMGNHDIANIIGMSDIHIKTNLGCKLVLKDVRHVVDLRLNLISVGRLDDEDYDSRSHGIQHEMTVPGTPQHNAITERMNRTIIKKIICILSQTKLPKRFWDEALRTAVDVINLSPCTTLDADVAEHKVFRSRDVVFFEDQTLKDLKKEAPAKTFAEGLVDCDPVIPPVYQGDGGDVQEDCVEPDINLPAGHVEQEEVEEQLPAEPQLRRSSRQYLEVERLDVKTTFLHGDLEEEIYMEQPEGFKVKDMYTIDRLKKELSEPFAMKDIGPTKQILGMQISRDRKNKKIWLSQEKYIEKTCLGYCGCTKPGGCCMKTSSVRVPCKKALLTSNCRICQPFEIAKLKISRIVVGLTTGLNVSVKSTPGR